MRSPAKELSDEQICQIEEFLSLIHDAMNLEEVDGFFCALISGPVVVKPSEFLPYVFGSKMPVFTSESDTIHVMELLLQHWDFIASTLKLNALYFPCLYEETDGMCQAHSWVHGFMLGMALRQECWSGLMEDEENCGLLLAIMALNYEHKDDFEFNHPQITDDTRKNFIARMIVAVLGIYQYFSPQRTEELPRSIQVDQSNIDANAPCYCGSVQKLKHCHGAVTLH
ncbi:MAG: UPF0149 family protein [Burkholderiaceae bacterium]